jgi:putative ABC transport system ATP-binding protein
MIQLANAHRRFQVGEQWVYALNGVDLEIGKGQYAAIMGPSGSGKSTLLNVIGLVDRLTEGHYRLFGQDVTDLSDNALARLRREQIGFVFQFFHLIPRLTAAENIGLPLMLSGLPHEVRQAKIAETLAAVGLQDRHHHRPDRLSGGQRQRVAIARAMVSEPALLLADEPTGNLDRTSGREIIELLEHLHKRGLTLLLVTHDPELGARAERQIHVIDGRIDSDRCAPSPP